MTARARRVVETGAPQEKGLKPLPEVSRASGPAVNGRQGSRGAHRELHFAVEQAQVDQGVAFGAKVDQMPPASRAIYTQSRIGHVRSL